MDGNSPGDEPIEPLELTCLMKKRMLRDMEAFADTSKLTVTVIITNLRGQISSYTAGPYKHFACIGQAARSASKTLQGAAEFVRVALDTDPNVAKATQIPTEPSIAQVQNAVVIVCLSTILAMVVLISISGWLFSDMAVTRSRAIGLGWLSLVHVQVENDATYEAFEGRPPTHQPYKDLRDRWCVRWDYPRGTKWCIITLSQQLKTRTSMQFKLVVW